MSNVTITISGDKIAAAIDERIRFFAGELHIERLIQELIKREISDIIMSEYREVVKDKIRLAVNKKITPEVVDKIFNKLRTRIITA